MLVARGLCVIGAIVLAAWLHPLTTAPAHEPVVELETDTTESLLTPTYDPRSSAIVPALAKRAFRPSNTAPILEPRSIVMRDYGGGLRQGRAWRIAESYLQNPKVLEDAMDDSLIDASSQSYGESEPHVPVSAQQVAAVHTTAASPLEDSVASALQYAERAAAHPVKASSEKPAHDSRPDRDDEDPFEEDDTSSDVGDESIGGRVMTRDGSGVANIAVRVRQRRVLDSFSEFGGDEPISRRVTTDGKGFFEFNSLPMGAYSLEAGGKEIYHLARKTVRAGVQSAQLVLEPRATTVRLTGVVRAALDSAPLPGVSVSAFGFMTRPARTNRAGQYTLELKRNGGAQTPNQITFTFKKAGYRDALVTKPKAFTRILNDGALASARSGRVDAVLTPIDNTTTVRGQVRDRTGLPVAGEKLQLYSSSPKRRHKAVTNELGEFTLTGVEPGTYKLIMRPRDPFRDYVREDVQVAANSAPLSIVLDDIALATLSGRMVDAHGHPVPDFTLWMKSAAATGRAAQQVTSDADGHYVVEDVPEGSIAFSTRSEPSVAINGVRMRAGEERSVPLIIDWGEHELSGRLLDAGGAPLAAQRLSLVWTHARNGVTYRSSRSATSDEHGDFVFSRLGPGTHVLSASVPGIGTHTRRHEVGTDESHIEMRLTSS